MPSLGSSSALIKLLLFSVVLCLGHSFLFSMVSRKASRNPRISFPQFRKTEGAAFATDGDHSDLPKNSVAQKKLRGHASTLRLLSKHPPLWITSEPILTPNECRSLSQVFSENCADTENGKKTIAILQKRLDQVLCRAVDEPTVNPRFLEYEPTDEPGQDSVETVIPDGLHVDTADDGGSCSRRYLSVIFYLTDSESAATTFPLAVHLTAEADSIESLTSHESKSALQAAEVLLKADVQHTHCCSSDKEEFAAAVLERAAFKVYQHKASTRIPGALPVTSCIRSDKVGLRVLPRKGHLVVFCFVTPSGEVDARSWHSSEALQVGHEKQVLTFFYKIKSGNDEKQSTPYSDFGHQVQQTMSPILERYGP